MKFSFLQSKTMDSLKRLLDQGLRKLTFEDNFFSTVREITVPAGQEIQVPHDLNVVPKYYILGTQDAEGTLLKGDLDWTTSFITIKNNGSNTITATIVIAG